VRTRSRDRAKASASSPRTRGQISLPYLVSASFVSVCLYHARERCRASERARATFARSSSHPDEISGRGSVRERIRVRVAATGCYQKCRAADSETPRLSPAEIQASLVKNDNGKSRPESRRRGVVTASSQKGAILFSRQTMTREIASSRETIHLGDSPARGWKTLSSSTLRRKVRIDWPDRLADRPLVDR